MKIAFLSHLDINLYLFRLSWMKALIKKGHDVYAVSPRGKFFDRFAVHGITAIEYDIDRGSLNPLGAMRTIHSLYRIFRKEGFDVVHTFTVKPNIYGAFAGRLSGARAVVSHVTGLGFFFTENGLKARLLRPVISLAYLFAFRTARKVVFQNSDDLAALGHLVSGDKAVLIKGTGVDVHHFAPEAPDKKALDSLRKEFRIDEGAVVITMIARLLWSKGIREFAEAADMLLRSGRNLIFIIVGWLDTGNPAAVSRDFISDTSRDPRIIFTGERDDIREILAVTDVYVLPSYREGTPRTVLEAMSMQKPVVTTDVPGCRQTVEDGVTGILVPAGDPAALSLAIGKLSADQGMRKAMGIAGRDKAVAEFSDEVVIERLFRLYAELNA